MSYDMGVDFYNYLSKLLVDTTCEKLKIFYHGTYIIKTSINELHKRRGVVDKIFEEYKPRLMY
jgi:hypothetical protein